MSSTIWTVKMSLVIIDGKRRYRLHEPLAYHSVRYNRTITVPAGFTWDGATKAIDHLSMAHCVHDYVVGTDGHEGVWAWDDGATISVWASSMILRDILKSEGRSVTAGRWFKATLAWQGFKRIWGK